MRAALAALALALAAATAAPAPARGGGVHPDDAEFAALVGGKQDSEQGPFREVGYLDYWAIKEELERLEKTYPDLVEVFDAQSRYNLPSPGSCGKRGKCKQYVLRITNEATLPEPERPEVFFSGELHGNERVGPTTLMEFARLLLESYTTCSNAWLHRLVNTRAIYIMPTTNALGYYRNARTENTVDPNRDFPIDKPHTCMETIAARAVNELWREHLFQLALTYHGGMQAIAFEWGTVSRHHDVVSPDDVAQLMFGSSMSAVAGDMHKGEGPYPHDRLNDLVYPVRGGMEDWGYAASWEGSSRPCNPKHFQGYAAEKTQYSKYQLRAFNILIETAKDKIPNDDTLGTTEQMMRPEGEGDGHIPRNVRLALFITDLVQPYVQWVRAPENGPGSAEVGDDGGDAVFAWEVGGALYVDRTFLEYTYADANGTLVTRRTAPLSGPTRWNTGGVWNGANAGNSRGVKGLDISLVTDDDLHDRERWPFAPAFEQALPALPANATLHEVVAVATVDQNWKSRANGASPALNPQSHVVNARTNPQWRAVNANHVIVGKVEWSADPIAYPRVPREERYCGGYTRSPTSSETTGGLRANKSADNPVPVAFVVACVLLSFLGGGVACRLYLTSRHLKRITYEPIDPSA